MNDHPTTYIPNWAVLYFYKMTFVSRNTNLNGSGSVFLKENLVLVLKLRPNSSTILGNVFFLGQHFAKF